MVSILPSERTPFDVIGKDVGRALQGVMPGAVQQGFQRGQGLSAIDQLQEALGSAGGDINKILPALAKAYTLNPNLERSGLGQQYLQQARLGQAFGGQGGQGGAQQSPSMPGQQPQGGQPIPSMGGQQQPQQQPSAEQERTGPQPEFAKPSPFNIMTPQDMDAEAKRFALALNDPNAYSTRFAQLQGQNEAATGQRQALEQAALDAGVDPADLPRFMNVNSHLDPRNPSQWAQNAKRNFAQVKNNDQKIRRTFIPGVGNGLLGQDRAAALKRLEGPVQQNAKMGLEQEDRAYLAGEYLTPTEIETLYHPETPKLKKGIEGLERGLFPAEVSKKGLEGWKGLTTAQAKKSPFISYEEAQERDPQALQIMQDRLSKFFMGNVDKDTSLLGIREKLWEDKDYDWRQIGPAIRQAQESGLELTPDQEREMSTIETQPPMRSLGDIFKGFDRVAGYLRGSK